MHDAESGKRKRHSDDEDEEDVHKEHHSKRNHEEDEETSDTEMDACVKCKKGSFKEKRVPVRSLHPTQLAVGMYQVSFKNGGLKQMLKEGSLKKYLESHPVPVVEGPGGKLYMTDHHHLCSALLKLELLTPKKQRDELRPYVMLADKELRRDWSTDAEESTAFWQDMLDHKCAWPGTVDHVMLSAEELMKALPRDVSGLVDDPYRSLAAYLRYVKGYKKPEPGGGGSGNEDDIFFVEFQWARYLREKMPVLRGEPDNAAVLEDAKRWARDPDAAGLPGYKGEKGGDS